MKRLERQKERIEARLRLFTQFDQRFTLARASIVGLGTLITTAYFFWREQVNLWIPIFFVFLFAVVVLQHRRLDRSRLRYRQALELVHSQLARLQLDWAHIPAFVAVQADPVHPFAADLSITGPHSLHHLIDTAASRGGSERLAAWFLDTVPNLKIIRERQGLLDEMAPLHGFRKNLALKGLWIKAGSSGPWDGEKLLAWLDDSSNGPSLMPVLGVLIGLAAANISLYILNAVGVLPAYWIFSLVLYAAIYLYQFSRISSLFAEVYQLGKSLDQFRSVLVFLESYPYPKAGDLARICRPFLQAEQRPSTFLKQIVWITAAASLGSNPMVSVLVNALLPWNLFFAQVLKRYKRTLKGPLKEWLDAWYELEASSSLANFAYLNPEYVFPQVSEERVEGLPVFETHGLGHPLLPDAVRVCNDYRVDRLGQIAIITGSNMSGKSTFLRTVGINLCLANSGAPVCAESLDTLLFRIFTSIQVNDSLNDGISFFYAEVRRLKMLLDEIKKPSAAPVFYMIDEIYRGTNNRERRIGSQAYIHALAKSQSVGLVSTHDLDLVHLSDGESDVSNYHFREEIKGSQMEFDYRLRPGPSPTTNALKIMELEGLPVDG